MPYDRRYMVKQYLTRLVVDGGRKVFDVYNTGENGWVLFQPVLGHKNGIGGYAANFQIPVRKKDLKREIARLIPRP